MHTSGRMVFTMTLLAAATPFVLPRVLAPAGSGNPHPAAIGNAHPANFGDPHPADFGNPHPANFGNPHPALTPDAHPAFPTEFRDDENVTIDPSQVRGNVTFAFPRAAHVTIVLPDGVQFAVNDSRGVDGNRGTRSDVVQTPGAAVVTDPKTGQILPPLGAEVVTDPKTGKIVPPLGAAVVTDSRTGQIMPPLGAGVVTNSTPNAFNEPAGAQSHIRSRNH